MRTTLAGLSITFGIVMAGLYYLRPNWATAATIFPAWSWVLVFGPLGLPAFRYKIFRVVCIVWILFTLCFVEEIKSLSKSLIPKGSDAQAIKVITINCSGSIKALSSALQQDPDIVLIQETPQQSVVETWLEQHSDYAYAHGIDTSILVRGRIDSSSHKAFFYNSISAHLNSRKVQITSLRLSTSNPRMDLWNPDCWKAQRRTREGQLNQILKIQEYRATHKHDYEILGGDFNVPQGDKVFHQIHDTLDDTFREGGRGWCNTILNVFPLLRIDQIWTSPGLHCLNAETAAAEQTDRSQGPQ